MAWIIVLIAAALLAAVILAVVIRTARFKPSPAAASGVYTESSDTIGAQKLAEAVRLKTVSYIDGAKIGRSAFGDFHALLERQFPLVHKACEKTVVNGCSLIYRLKAAKAEPLKKPALITAHIDVVPVEEGTEQDWSEPPFSGSIKDGFVWGRGTLDTKIHVVAALEALERLLEKGFSPERDLYFAFGHDEELGGQEGAAKLAETFKNSGLEFDFVLDEGGCVATNVIPGIDKPLALVGVGEKGYANILLTVTSDGGHASMPAPHTSLGILADALRRIENRPFRMHLIEPTRAFLRRIGPHMSGLNRVILSNLWLFKPVFLSIFGKMKSGSALLRTTIAVTMAQGAPAPNIVPRKSSAVINSRILPGENGDDLLGHFRKSVKGLPVNISPIILDNPSALSPTDTESFGRLEALIEEVCPGAIVAPYLVLASTDAKKYEPVSRNIYRFTPYLIDNSDLGRIHGTNERISVENVNRCIDFFTGLYERL